MLVMVREKHQGSPLQRGKISSSSSSSSSMHIGAEHPVFNWVARMPEDDGWLIVPNHIPSDPFYSNPEKVREFIKNRKASMRNPNTTIYWLFEPTKFFWLKSACFFQIFFPTGQTVLVDKPPPPLVPKINVQKGSIATCTQSRFPGTYKLSRKTRTRLDKVTVSPTQTIVDNTTTSTIPIRLIY